MPAMLKSRRPRPTLRSGLELTYELAVRSGFDRRKSRFGLRAALAAFGAGAGLLRIVAAAGLLRGGGGVVADATGTTRAFVRPFFTAGL